MISTPSLDLIAHRSGAEVFHARQWGLAWGEPEISELKLVASDSPRRRARLCMHPDQSDSHQEMLIVLAHDAIERAQRRTIGFDTKIALEGSAVLRYYAESGDLSRSVPLGPGQAMYVHTNCDLFHNLEVTSEWFVFLEILAGPFDSHTTEFAPWS